MSGRKVRVSAMAPKKLTSITCAQRALGDFLQRPRREDAGVVDEGIQAPVRTPDVPPVPRARARRIGDIEGQPMQVLRGSGRRGGAERPLGPKARVHQPAERASRVSRGQPDAARGAADQRHARAFPGRVPLAVCCMARPPDVGAGDYH